MGTNGQASEEGVASMFGYITSGQVKLSMVRVRGPGAR